MSPIEILSLSIEFSSRVEMKSKLLTEMLSSLVLNCGRKKRYLFFLLLVVLLSPSSIGELFGKGEYPPDERSIQMPLL